MHEDFQVGKWYVRPDRGVLCSEGEEVQLEPRVMDLLAYLASHPDEVLSKERLLQAVWPEPFVADDVLTSAIWKLRQALGDDSKSPSYIQTFPRRGYQFICKDVLLPGKNPGRLERQLNEPLLDSESPYPGLCAFSAKQSEYFFGREMEIASIWQKLQRSPLLGLIGPSGAGKSSLLRAGVIAAAPDDWACVIATPRANPFLSLAQSLSGELTGDPEGIRELLSFGEPNTAVSVVRKWRNRSREALIIIDQFEELFTLNRTEEQDSFINFIGRLVIEADVHLLMSMRDDFLFQCHGHEELEPIFLDITPLGPPEGRPLKEALVAPAEKRGFQFEDENLVDEMLSSVKGIRGRLPLLAFAVAELWKKRDREGRRLVREAYEEIGGVEGALARHSEGTLERLGPKGRPIVRELFRNFLTAQGTSSPKNRDELLSVFPEDSRVRASRILDELINARLLVSYSRPGQSEGGISQIEIAHESLLTHWPRLVRWIAQDAEGSHLRDDLRQSSRQWDQRGRPKGLLWQGTAVREYELWRERYPGRLTELENAFGISMLRQANLKKRRRKMALAGVVVISMFVSLTTIALWHRAVRETRRAEAEHFLAEARLFSESDPTAAVALATRSLELSDQETSRLLVARLLSQGPFAFTSRTEHDVLNLSFSPDGTHLVGSGHGSLHLMWHSDGSPVDRLKAHSSYIESAFSRDGHYMISWSEVEEKREFIIWRLPELLETKRFQVDLDTHHSIHPDGVLTLSESARGSVREAHLIPFEAGRDRELGEWPWIQGENRFHFGSDEIRMVSLTDNDHGSDLSIITGLPDHPSPPRKFAQTNGTSWRTGFLMDGTQFATFGESKQIDIWSVDAPDDTPFARRQGPRYLMNDWSFDESGSWLAIPNGADKRASVWDLTAPVSFGPLVLRHGGRATSAVSVHPDGRCVAVGDSTTVSLWPLRRSYPSVVFRHDSFLQEIVFDPKGRWVALSTFDGKVHLWSLELEGDGSPKVLFEIEGILAQMSVSPDGDRIAVGRWDGTIYIVSLWGGPVQELKGFHSPHDSLTFDESGKKLASAAGFTNPSDNQIRVWDLESGEVQVLRPPNPEGSWLQFSGENELYSSSLQGLRRWNLKDQTFDPIVENAIGSLSPNGRFYLGVKKAGIMDPGRDLRVYDLEQGTNWALPSHGDNIYQVRWSPNSDAVITSSYDGPIRVSDLRGESTHILYGHAGKAVIKVEPSSRWIASAGKLDGTFRFWPIPDLSKPPLHTLPHDQLIARLKALTNYRVVADEDAPTGYRIEFGPLPGWDQLPEE